MLCLSLLLAAVPGALGQQAAAQQPSRTAPVPARVLSRVDDAARTVLAHSHPASLAHATIGGRLPASTPLTGMVLVLQPSAAQQAALATVLDQQQDRTSPAFHHWLTPDTFAQGYGVAPADLAAITAWLQASGLTVQQVSRGARFLTFSGPGGAVEYAFHTELHHVVRRGEAHVANTTDLSIPAALAPVVRGVARLDDLYPRASALQGAPVQLRRQPNGALQDDAARPSFGTTALGVHYVAPGDAAVIYNAVPLTRAGVDGHGVTIAVLGRSNVAPATVAAFRTLFGLPANPLAVTVVGTDPGFADDSTEAYLDTEWAGSLATGSTVQLITSAASLTSSGIDAASLYAVDNNIGDILSLSYGECESDATSAGTAFWNSLWQQAAAQGQTVFVSSGDSGAAGCDRSTNGFADGGFGVNALGSSAYNVAVGGTMFVDYGPAQYWSATSTTPYTSALGYIPEAAWNQGRLTSTDLNGTASTTVTDTGIVAGGGGVSIDTPRPSWQTGSQILVGSDPFGSASGSTLGGLHRLVPDVAMLASFGHDGSLFCATGMCTGSGPLLHVGVVGGTSIAAPVMASAQALIDARNGGRQGNANVVYYALSARQTAAGLHCQATTGTAASPTVALPDAACDFQDIVTGSNVVPTAPTGTLGLGFPAIGGFDEATGLGSINIANLANDWASGSFRSSTSTFSLAPATGIAHGTVQTFTVTVAPGSGDAPGTPTGTVTLLASNRAGPLQQVTLANGSVTGNLAALPAGDFTVHAHYSGDATFSAVDSAPIAVSIAPEASTLTLTPQRLDATGGIVPAATFSYGAGQIGAAATVIGRSGTGTPTGDITFTLQNSPQGSPTLPVLTTVLDGTSSAVLRSGPNFPGAPANLQTLPPGSYRLTSAYAGDTSFLPSSGSSTFTVTRAIPSLQLSVATPVAAGAGAVLQLGIVTPPAATPATGTVRFTDTTTGALLCAVALDNGGAACATTVLFAAGTHLLTATYPGDTNYGPATSDPLPVTVQTVSVTVAPIVIAYGTASTQAVATVSVPQPGTLSFLTDGAAPVPAACGVTATATTCTASLPTGALAVGPHVLTATFTAQPAAAASLTATGNGSLTVTPAVALLTLSGLDAIDDGTPHAATVVTTPANLNVTLTYNGQPTPPSAAGTYTVVAAVHDGSYTGTATATLRIAPAAAAITFAVPPHSFSDAPFLLFASSASSGSYTYAVLSGPATITGNTVILTGAGIVVLQATQAPAGGYGAGRAQATVVVSPATPVLAWPAPASIAYGTVLGAQQLNASATVNGQPVPGTFTYTPAAGTVLDAGTHALCVQFLPSAPANFATAAAAATLVIQPAVTALTLTASANPAAVGTPVTFTATLQAGVAAPFAGDITFQSDGVPLGTAPMQQGVATLTFALPAGAHAVLATYAGSTNAAASSATLRQIVTAPLSFSVSTPADPAVTLPTGGSAALALQVTPSAGFTGTVLLACADLPANVACGFAPSAVSFTGTGLPQTVSVQFTAAAQHSLLARPPAPAGSVHLALLFGLPILLLAEASHRRRRASCSPPPVGERCRPYPALRLFVLGGMAALLGSTLAGCGSTSLSGAATQTAVAAATPGTYTIHLVASSGSTVQAMPVTLTVQ